MSGEKEKTSKSVFHRQGQGERRERERGGNERLRGGQTLKERGEGGEGHKRGVHLIGFTSWK